MTGVRLYRFAPGGGYDPYNTAETHHKTASLMIAREVEEARARTKAKRDAEAAKAVAQVDATIRRGFKVLANLARGPFTHGR